MAHRTTTLLLTVLFFVGTKAFAQTPDEAATVEPDPKIPPSSPASDEAAEADTSEPEGAADEATDEGQASNQEESGDSKEPTEPAETTNPGELDESQQPNSELLTTSETTEPQQTPDAAESPPPESLSPTRPTTRPSDDAPAVENEPTSDEPPREGVKLQKPFARQGEFAAVGAHFGMATADDKDYGMRKLSLGPAFTLRLGEAIVDWADIGLEFGFGLQGGEEKLTSGRVIAHTRLYPIERLFIHTGFGFGFAGGPDPEEPEFNRFRYGDVYVLGVGTNLYLRDRNKSGGPMFSPSLTFELGPDREFTTGVVWLGAEFSWWAGLRRHQLDLPIDDAYSRSPGD